MRVRVYRNLNNGLMSVQDAQSKLIIGHCESIDLRDVQFIVNEAGRQRVLRDHRKNVHAFVQGEFIRARGFIAFKHRDLPRSIDSKGEKLSFRVRYDPYQMSHFTGEDGTPISTCNRCQVSTRGVFIPAL